MSLTKVSNDRIAGWLNLREWLKPHTDELGQMIADIRIFSNCINLIRTLPAIQLDPKNPSDCMTDPHELTHAPDALRYFVSGRPKRARPQTPMRSPNFKSERPPRSPVGIGDKIKPI